MATAVTISERPDTFIPMAAAAVAAGTDAAAGDGGAVFAAAVDDGVAGGGDDDTELDDGTPRIQHAWSLSLSSELE